MSSDVLYGCDVSEYQEGLNLGALTAEGYSFCWIRASIGIDRDPEFYRFLWSAQSSGMLSAGYHFLLPSRMASLETQALVFADQLRGTPGIVDVEPNGPGANPPTTRDVLGFLGWCRAYGANIRALYWPRWVWEIQGRPSLVGLPPLISSSYVPEHDVLSAVYPGDGWTGWNAYGGVTPVLGQVTDAAANGQGFSLDGDVYRGDLISLAEILGLEDFMALPRLVKLATGPEIYATNGMAYWHVPEPAALEDFIYNQHHRFGNPAMPATPETVASLDGFGYPLVTPAATP